MPQDTETTFAEMEARTGFVTVRDNGWQAGPGRFVCEFVAWDYDRAAHYARQASDEFSVDLATFASRRDALRFSMSHPKSAAWAGPQQ